MDDFTRLFYDAQIDSMLASKEDFSKLNSYYAKRANTILERYTKNYNSFSDSDYNKTRAGLLVLKERLDEYTSAWGENKFFKRNFRKNI